MANETDAPGSVNALRTRVARLSSTGTTPAGATNMYVTDTVVRQQWSPDVEAGDEIVKKNGSGAVCIDYRADDIIKRYTAELEYCSPDPELHELLLGGTVLTEDGSTIGYASPALGAAAAPNGVSVELWTLAVDGRGKVATNPYFWHAFPRTHWRVGAKQAAFGAMDHPLVGWIEENPNWGNGPNNDWEWASDKAYQWVRTSTLPAATVGYVATPAQT